MKITLSAIKADVGGVGGHTKPSKELVETVKKIVSESKLLLDSYIGYTGDDIHILMSHTRGVNNAEIHKLAFDAFMEATEVAKEQGLYGAGQDMLKTAFSGNVRGLGPGSAEIEFEERPNEAVMLFAADKTEPGAFNVPLYYGFVEVSRSPGLMLSNDMRKGVVFTIMDVANTEADKIIELKTPEEYVDIASLLFNPHRFVIEKIHSRSNSEQIAAVSTSRLHNISGKYSGKDDPIAIVRVQRPFLATEEIGAMFKYAHYVAGDTRGSHNMALMPVVLNSPSSVYYCNPLISGLFFSMHNGKFTAMGDAFDDPVFDEVRRLAATKSFLMREQGFVMPAMLPMEEIEYTILADKLKELDKKFVLRKQD
ncbi:MAG: fructose 1,6-bisphosphatase [Candidatus Aenigmarchaeota archaeon]|nr:fructose 1,6-bisphosphatase [Candidatus Aenigmarchaeota archaeon]